MRTDATLLVVDDNEDNRYILLVQRLQREGYRNILQAADGAEAMEYPERRAKSTWCYSTY